MFSSNLIFSHFSFTSRNLARLSDAGRDEKNGIDSTNIHYYRIKRGLESGELVYVLL